MLSVVSVMNFLSGNWQICMLWGSVIRKLSLSFEYITVLIFHVSSIFISISVHLKSSHLFQTLWMGFGKENLHLQVGVIACWLGSSVSALGLEWCSCVGSGQLHHLRLAFGGSRTQGALVWGYRCAWQQQRLLGSCSAAKAVPAFL